MDIGSLEEKLLAGKNMNKKILIAEDDIPIASALELKLQHSGFDTAHANNGEEAIEKLKSENFDLVILDLMMPKLDGFGVLEQMKKDGIKTPVIVASNLSQPEDEKKAMDLGATDFFVKSNVPLSELVIKIEAIVK